MTEKSGALEDQIDAADRKKTKFSVDILKLVSGTAVAQFISVASSPLIARLFTPEAFGVYALFFSIVGIVTAVSTLRYDIAMMLPEDDSDAANLMAGALGMTTLFSLLLIPIVWFGGPGIASWLNAPELVDYLWLAPIAVFFGGIGAGHPVLTAWSSRTRHFSQISITNVIGILVSTVMKIALGILGFGTGGGMIASGIVSSTIPPALLGRHIWKENRRLFFDSIRPSRIWQNLKRYRKFAIYNTPSALFNNVSWQVPSFMLAFFFSPTIVGYYSFGTQLLRLPMSLIGGSVTQVFYSHASAAHHEGKLAVFVERTFRQLVEYTFLPVLMLTVIGRELCVVIFGSEWAEAGVYLQILSAWTVFWFISTPMIKVFSVLEKNEASLRFNTLNFVTRVLSIWLGGIMGSPRLALIFFSISGALVYGYISISIVLVSGVSRMNVFRILFQNLMLVFLAAGGILLLKMMRVDDWVQVVAAALLVGIYFLYRLKDQPFFRKFMSKLGLFSNPLV